MGVEYLRFMKNAETDTCALYSHYLACVMQSCTPSQTKGAVCFSKDLCLFRKEVCCCEYDNKYELELQNSCDLSSGVQEAGEPPAESLQADVPVPLVDQRHRQ